MGYFGRRRRGRVHCDSRMSFSDLLICCFGVRCWLRVLIFLLLILLLVAYILVQHLDVG